MRRLFEVVVALWTMCCPKGLKQHEHEVQKEGNT